MKRVKGARAIQMFGLAVAVVLALAFAALHLQEATACPPPEGAVKKLVPAKFEFIWKNTGPVPGSIEMTPALGDIDGDNDADLVVQEYSGGRIYCFEFDNSTYDATMNTIAWPCMGRNAARTHYAD